MGKMLFVGERRSNKAKEMGVTWKDGRLAAKQLFDALNYCGIDPTGCEFTNWFERGKTKVRKHDGIIVAMGRKVSKALLEEGIKHLYIHHPAARGQIRTKSEYLSHVKKQLLV